MEKGPRISKEPGRSPQHQKHPDRKENETFKSQEFL
jgi:hypothetical protein